MDAHTFCGRAWLTAALGPKGAGTVPAFVDKVLCWNTVTPVTYYHLDCFCTTVAESKRCNTEHVA